MNATGHLFVRTERKIQHVVRGVVPRELAILLAADFDTAATDAADGDEFERPNAARELPEWAKASFVDRDSPASRARRALVQEAHRFTAELDRLRSEIGFDAAERLYARYRPSEQDAQSMITVTDAARFLLGGDAVKQRRLALLAVYMTLQEDADRFIADPRNLRTSGQFTLRSPAELDDLAIVREWIATDAPPVRAFAATCKMHVAFARRIERTDGPPAPVDASSLPPFAADAQRIIRFLRVNKR